MPVPILAVAAIAGLGLQAYGQHRAATIAGQQANLQANEASQQQAIEAQKQQQMQLQARRTEMEALRQNQVARSQATAAANSQGAIYGSGIQGGYGQISGQTGTNLVNQSQNLQIGENIFGLNSNISTDRIGLAHLGGSMATAQGISSFGGSLAGAAQAIGRLGAGFGGSSYGSPESGGGPSAYNPSKIGSLY